MHVFSFATGQRRYGTCFNKACARRSTRIRKRERVERAATGYAEGRNPASEDEQRGSGWGGFSDEPPPPCRGLPIKHFVCTVTSGNGVT